MVDRAGLEPATTDFRVRPFRTDRASRVCERFAALKAQRVIAIGFQIVGDQRGQPALILVAGLRGDDPGAHAFEQVGEIKF